MSANKIPLVAEELTIDWLQEIMEPHLHGAKLNTFDTEIIGVGEGFMGQLARVQLRYLEDNDLAPRSLIAKFAATRQETRDMAADQNLYQREIGFYRDIGAKCGVPIADCYYGKYIQETNQFVLLLEDLSPGEPADQVTGADKKTSRQVIEHFAGLHARWWNDESLHELDWARWIIKSAPMEQTLELYEKSLQEVEEHGKFDQYPEMKRLIRFLKPLFQFDPEPPYPFTLTHGDLRSDNIIRPTEDGGRLAVIDWQLCGVGDPVNDIVRWMTQSISIKDRKETEQELLKLYHDLLIKNGVKNYGYKKFINDYRLNLIVVYLMFSMSMDAVDQSSERAKALFHEFYSRLDSALADWQVEKTLRILPYIYPFLKFGLIVKKLFKGVKRP